MKPPAAITRIFDALDRHHPNADTELVHRNAFELLVATILSAQCTDVRVNMVTPALFARYPDAAAFAAAEPKELETSIQSPQMLMDGMAPLARWHAWTTS